MKIYYDSSARAPHPKKPDAAAKTKKGRIHFFDYQGIDKHKDKYAVFAKQVKTPKLGCFEKKYYIIQQDPSKSGIYYKINKGSLKKRLGITAAELKSVKNGDYAPLIDQKFQSIQKNDPDFFKKYSSIQDEAATIFQKFIRGRQQREAVLPENLTYKNYSKQVKLAEKSKNMPEARGGKTTVYLPKAMPEVVLKQSGRQNAIKRFHQMQDVRKILKKENCTHLVIPSANLYQHYLIETRLPINTSTFHNIEIYLSNPKLFDEVVREMTRLFSHHYLSDLVNDQYYSPLNYIGGDSVRYDNLPLYIDADGQGKIGLIDLEHIRKPNPESLAILARIFPFHQDIILDEANNIGMEIHEAEIKAAAEKGKNYMEEGYTKHINWLNNKNITPQSAQKFSLTPEREKQLIGLIEKELLSKGIGEPNAKNSAPLIYNNFLINFREKFEVNEKIVTGSQMLEARSKVVDIDKLFWRVIPSHIEKNIESRKLADFIFNELVNGGEIFHFSKNGNYLWTIRY